ncbi:MAG: hypothetical protein ABH823_01550 [bacterium]
MIWKWEKHKITEYGSVFKQLTKDNIRYLLIGGVAAVLHGVPRVTGDVDLMLQMGSDNILKFVKSMKKLGYVPKVPVKPEEFADPKKRKEWQEEKNMLVFSYHNPDDPYSTIDLMIDSPIEFEQAWGKRQVISHWGTEISLISLDDLIELKKIAGRDQDLSDIKLLNEIKRIKREQQTGI